MSSRLRIDKLRVDLHRSVKSPHTPLEQIADTAFPADRPRIDSPSFIGQSRFAGNDESPREARQIGRQVVGNGIREEVVPCVATEVAEG